MGYTPPPYNPYQIKRRKIDFCKKEIVFVYADPVDPQEDGEPGPGENPHGTGFIVNLLSSKGTPRKLIITNAHVLQKDDRDLEQIVLRVNNIESAKAHYLPLELHRTGSTQNTFLPDRSAIDLAAILLPDSFQCSSTGFDRKMVPGATERKSQPIEMGMGVLVVGYVSGYAGNELNHPIARSGLLALTSDEFWYASERNPKVREQAHLIDVQMSGGMSGSPVVSSDSSGNLILGVIKGSMNDINGGPQGVVAIEPASNLVELLDEIADRI